MVAVMQCTSFWVAPQIDLAMIRQCYNLAVNEDREDHLIIDGESLTEILLAPAQDRKLWIFRFGCLVLIDFNEDETSQVLRQISSILPRVDYQAMTISRESVNLDQLGVGDPSVRKAAAVVLPDLMARSVGFHELERRLDGLLSEADRFIDHLKRNRRWLRIGYSQKIIRQIILFQFAALHRVNLPDLPISGNTEAEYLASRLIAAYFEMADRTSVFDQKMKQLSSWVDAYTSSRLDATFMNFYWMEVLLLAIFPLLHFVPMGQDWSELVGRVRRWLEQIMPWLADLCQMSGLMDRL
jgi:hypothetical protein